MIKKTMLLAVFLPAFSAWAGDLSVDNLTVSNNATIMENLNFSTVTTSTNGGGASATGGIITTNGNYLIHTFTNSGTFQISGAITCDVLVVAGGGGGGHHCASGGGGGGVVRTNNIVVSENMAVVVGTGGLGAADSHLNVGASGSNSSFGNIAAYGGGGGTAGGTAGSGGSGGGKGYYGGTYGAGTAGQGYDGGHNSYGSAPYCSAGGGGAGGMGGDGTSSAPGAGGIGIADDISGTSIYYGGGGGGSSDSAGGAAGGIGGGGAGGGQYLQGHNGTNGFGGGGGGGGNSHIGGKGGSGIVIVRYSSNQSSSSNTTTLTISSNGISQASASGSNVFMGNVGIGTNNPAEKLHVAGNVQIEGSIKLGGESRTNWPNVAVGALIASNNLSDVANVETARSNLGLGSAATYDSSAFLTTNGNGSYLTNITAAQVGAVGTNAGALLEANNLSELSATAATARSNLGLGSAATNNADAFLAPAGNGSQLTGITAAQVGALSTTGGVVNGASYFIIPAEGMSMGSFTNQ